MIQIGDFTLSLSDPLHLAGVLGAGAVVLLLFMMGMALRAARRSTEMIAPVAQQTARLSKRLETVTASQQQLVGGLSQVSETQAVTQAQMLATVERRLEEVTRSMGDSLHGSSTRTARSLGELQQRLSTIDKAQENIEKLSGDVLGLQDILSNKQARGAFGEVQLAAILQDALPNSSYSLQATLSNGKRADCLIHLPNPPGPLVIDSKFPLEAYEAYLAADTPRGKTDAERSMRGAVRAHLRAISEKYIIPGETADSAVMFVPSEAVYALLHGGFPELIRESFAARVWIVSPTTCMATLTTLQAVLKDVAMREQAGIIRRELGFLLADVGRLSDRVGNLDRHFAQAQKDLTEIRVSANKADIRARKLDTLDFEETAENPVLQAVRD